MFRRALCPILALIAALPCVPALAAGSLDDALDEIAAKILQDIGDTNRPTLAISTFTHSGSTCSDLSNYISEVMLPTVQNAGDRNLRIYARSQLSAIFRELKLVYDGTISPNAAQRIGKISGVEAILTGTITPFGEQMMVTSTLIATSDGGVLGAANASFPITATVRGMMEQRGAALCGFDAPASAAPDTPPKRPGPSGDTHYSSDVFEADVVGLYYAPSTGEATWSLRFSNISDSPIGLSYVPKSLAIADGMGGVMEQGSEWSGIRTCYGENSLGYCNTSRPQYATTLAPGKVAQLNFNTIGTKELSDPALTLTLEMVVTPDTADPNTYNVRSIGFFDLAPVVR